MVILESVEEKVGETVGGPTARFKSDSEQTIDIRGILHPFIKRNPSSFIWRP